MELNTSNQAGGKCHGNACRVDRILKPILGRNMKMGLKVGSVVKAEINSRRVKDRLEVSQVKFITLGSIMGRERCMLTGANQLIKYQYVNFW